MKKIYNKDYSADPQEWLKRVNKDLKLANKVYQDVDGYFEYSCFLCQQAAEKCLKAYIVKKQKNIAKKQKTHRLLYLSKVCKKLGLNLEYLEGEFAFLNSLYTPTRYPHSFKIMPTKQDAQEALKSARRVIKFIKPYLK